MRETPALRPSLLALLCAIVLALLVSSPAFCQKKSTRPFPINRFIWSRHAQQDGQGYYYQPLGVGEDYANDARTQERLDADFAVMRDAGIKLFRVGITWGNIEYRPGKYDWTFWDRLIQTAVKNHVVLIPYVCYAPLWSGVPSGQPWTQPPTDPQLFRDFMQTIAARYRGKVRSWELWNEPDNPAFWGGSVEQFAGLVKAGAEGVRAGDPKATIVLGGIAGNSDFLRTLIDQYRIGDYVDVVNFHNYFETWSNDLIEHTPDYVKEMADSAGGAHVTQDLWLAEFGYSDLLPGTGSGIYDVSYQHTPQFQAVALWRMQILALSTGKLSLSTWYRINDLTPEVGVIGDDNNRYLGLVDIRGKKKPVFSAMRFYNQLFGNPVRCIDSQVAVTKPAESQSVIHLFELKDKEIIVTAWLRTPQPGDLPSRDSLDLRREEISVRLPAGKWTKATTYDPSGQQIKMSAVLSGRSLSHIPVTGPTIFIARVSR